MSEANVVDTGSSRWIRTEGTERAALEWRWRHRRSPSAIPGWGGARLAFGLGIVGAGFVAALVISVAGSWGIMEALCLPHSLNQRPREARWFYGVYTLAHVGGAIVVLSGVSLVQLTMNIEVMNAILLPVVLWFLLVLEARALPAEFRMKGLHRYGAWFMAGIVMALGLVMAGRTMFIWV